MRIALVLALASTTTAQAIGAPVDAEHTDGPSPTSAEAVEPHDQSAVLTTIVAPTIRVLFTNDDFVQAAGHRNRSGRAFPRLSEGSMPRGLDGLLRFVPGTTGIDRARTFHGGPLSEVHVHLDGAEILVPPGWQGLR